MTQYQFALICDLVERVRRDIPVQTLPTCRAGHSLLASSTSRSVAVRIEEILDRGDEDTEELAHGPDEDEDHEYDDDYELEDDDEDDYADEDDHDDEDDLDAFDRWINSPLDEPHDKSFLCHSPLPEGIESVILSHADGGYSIYLRSNKKLATSLGFTFQHVVRVTSLPPLTLLQHLANKLLQLYQEP